MNQNQTSQTAVEIHPLLQEQMREVWHRHPDAAIIPLAHGAHVVTVPGVRLSERWTPNVVTLVLYLPPGFPMASPAHFWTQEIVRVDNGRFGSPLAQPWKSTEGNPVPGCDSPVGTWFGWALQAWNPNRDTIYSWLNAVRQRLRVESNTEDEIAGVVS